ncbi:MAG: recombinase family protein [Patescibacteria group bacterium]
MHKYFLYARKSTDNEERQVLSIEAQIAELKEFATKNQLEIVEEMTESMTAKQPGRPVFNEMLTRIENDEADGIIAWNPDRLARNAVDGGQIIHLIDQGKIQALKFPTYWFEPSSQGLFMLQIAFGQAKYYIDNLSENVKRGQRQKLRRGEYPSRALIGYVNNLRNHTIEIDPERAPKVKQLFEAYATGKYTLKAMQKLSLSLGLVGLCEKKPLALSVIQNLLKKNFYLGLFVFNGETYEGKHPPLIDKALFDTVQQVMKDNGKPRKVTEELLFPYRGLFKCAECGCAITGERHTKKSGLVFRYYRCTKKKNVCRQKYVSEKILTEQINKMISIVALPDDMAKPMLEQVDNWQSEESTTSALAAADVKQKLSNTEKQLSRLLDAHLQGSIEAYEYQSKKSELMTEKVALKQKLGQISRQGVRWLEPMRKWIQEAHQAHFILHQENLQAKAELIRKIGSNRLLNSGNAAVVREKEWKIFPENSRFTDWRGKKESNPR